MRHSERNCVEAVFVSIDCSINIIILLPTPFKLDKTELPRLLYISLGCCKHAIELRLGECRDRISVSDRSLPLEAFHVFQCVL